MTKNISGSISTYNPILSAKAANNLPRFPSKEIDIFSTLQDRLSQEMEKLNVRVLPLLFVPASSLAFFGTTVVAYCKSISKYSSKLEQLSETTHQELMAAKLEAEEKCAALKQDIASLGQERKQLNQVIKGLNKKFIRLKQTESDLLKLESMMLRGIKLLNKKRTAQNKDFNRLQKNKDACCKKLNKINEQYEKKVSTASKPNAQEKSLIKARERIQVLEKNFEALEQKIRELVSKINLLKLKNDELDENYDKVNEFINELSKHTETLNIDYLELNQVIDEFAENLWKLISQCEEESLPFTSGSMQNVEFSDEELFVRVNLNVELDQQTHSKRKKQSLPAKVIDQRLKILSQMSKAITKIMRDLRQKYNFKSKQLKELHTELKALNKKSRETVRPQKSKLVETVKILG